MKAVGSREVG